MPLFRGNVSMVEVKSVDTNPTKLPDVEPLQAGKIDVTTTRCFDLLCVGKYEQGSNLKLNIQPADEIPNLITKNTNGDPIFNEPKPMCTVRAPKGHNVWVKIYLKTITTNATNYMALGIKKQCEDEYFDILHTGNSSRYVDVLETDVVELVPLVSSTPLSEKYTAVNPGDIAKITDKSAYDFGSVYRVHISLHNSQWLTAHNDLTGICDITIDGWWYNYGKMGVGSVTDQDNNIHENQLVAINRNGTLAYSTDGTQWTQNGTVGNDYWYAGPVYGNGIWCIISSTYGVKRSIDGGKSWSNALANICSYCLNFANSAFMTVSCNNPGVVYTSPDAEIWTSIGSVKFTSGDPYILVYGNGKWICGSSSGYVCQSIDGKEWEQVSDDLHKMCSTYKNEVISSEYAGGCYVNGYYYVVFRGKLIARSSDGIKWKKVLDHSNDNPGNYSYLNITHYKNKLWMFAVRQIHMVGLFNPDGTIESLEN